MKNKTNIDNIELRSEKVRHIIGKVPPRLVRTGTVIITLVVIALGIAFYAIRYPMTIEAQGEVASKDSLKIYVPYKYLYLFNEPRQVRVTYEGQAENAAPSAYPIISYNDKLIMVDGSNYFLATACISSDITKVHIGQKIDARIIVSDKTLLQQIFKQQPQRVLK